MEYLQFELVDVKPFLKDVFGIEESESVNIHFEQSGYETSDFILNMGPAFLSILVAPVYLLFMLLI